MSTAMFGKGTGDPQAARLCCPNCGLYCRPVAYLPGEVAVFDCERMRGGCERRYFLGLGSSPALTCTDRLPVCEPGTIDLPGFRLIPSRHVAVWRGEQRPVAGRSLQVLQALAEAYPHGRSTDELADAFWGDDAYACGPEAVRFYVHRLRLLLPGLIACTGRGGRAGLYHLALAPAVSA